MSKEQSLQISATACGAPYVDSPQGETKKKQKDRRRKILRNIEKAHDIEKRQEMLKITCEELNCINYVFPATKRNHT